MGGRENVRRENIKLSGEGPGEDLGGAGVVENMIKRYYTENNF